MMTAPTLVLYLHTSSLHTGLYYKIELVLCETSPIAVPCHGTFSNSHQDLRAYNQEKGSRIPTVGNDSHA
jgi:hypothetical protein